MERRFGVCYDFRNPPDSGIPMPSLYAQALEQISVAQPARYYRMEPKRKQYDSGLQTFAWPRGEVIDPLGLSVDALFARVRAGDVYIPALVSTREPAGPSCTISRRASSVATTRPMRSATP